MQEVVCWCCEYFILSEKLKSLNGKFINGKCEYHGLSCFSESKVCEEFQLRSGLHTTKITLDICNIDKGAICSHNK
jgi:hypothetical protein